MKLTLRRRLILIGCASALMLATISVIGESVRASWKEAKLSGEPSQEQPSIPVEGGVFRLIQKALAYKNAPETDAGRQLNGYYGRRAFPGAPPVIPHPTFDERSIGGKACMGCHAEGGFVPFLKAYAPVTPHPEMSNCKQCHASGHQEPGRTPSPFASSRFDPLPPPAIQGAALPGAPPPIPHSLDMRSNCLACHAGPGAPKQIRTSHPERVNCRQCHVQNVPGEPAAPFFQNRGSEPSWEP